MIHYYEHIERKYGLHEWFLSMDSVVEDRHYPNHHQQQQQLQQQQQQQQQQPAEGLGTFVCEMHAKGDRLQTYSPQWKVPAHFSREEEGGEDEDAALKRDKHNHNRHLDMPPEVFM